MKTPPIIRLDRANHYVYGSWSGLAGLALARVFPGFVTPALGALLAGAVVGLLREVLPGGNRSRVDFAWTLGGALSVALPVWAVS